MACKGLRATQTVVSVARRLEGLRGVGARAASAASRRLAARQRAGVGEGRNHVP